MTCGSTPACAYATSRAREEWDFIAAALEKKITIAAPDEV
jgi:hypothetical protein